MIEDDLRLPEWASYLRAEPIVLNDSTSDGTLVEAVTLRLSALLELYRCDPTADGWRNLALKLALEHQIDGKRTLEFHTPVDRMPGYSGAEPGKAWFNYGTLRSRAKATGSMAKAVDEMAKTGLSKRRLRNLASDGKARRLKPPRWWARMSYEGRIHRALDAAADALERKHRR